MKSTLFQLNSIETLVKYPVVLLIVYVEFGILNDV